MLPTLLTDGGPVIWLILIAAAVALVVFIERVLFCHRSQINSGEFLNGVRNVLKRDNVVEAISICDATPGPVARLVKAAILNRDRGRERVREAVEEAGLSEVPQLEERLNLLATIAQLAPLLGLLGTVIGFIRMFMQLQAEGPYAHLTLLSSGIWQALICAAAGIAVAIPVHAGYNYLVSRINKIVLDMERAAGEIVNIVTENGGPKIPMKFPRKARLLRSTFDLAPYAVVFFLLIIFLTLAALLPTPGLSLHLPAAGDLPGADKPTVTVAVDAEGRLFFANQIVTEKELISHLHDAVIKSREPLTLVVQADKAVTYDQLVHLTLLAREPGIGITNFVLATLPRVIDASGQP